MKRSLGLILFVLICLCGLGNSSCDSGNAKRIGSADMNKVLIFYRNYSRYTDPGKYAYLYKNLPDSLSELCELINFQLIHPLDIGPYLHVIPLNRDFEDNKFPTVEKILAGLLELDPKGLTSNRKPENRLILTCRYHAILLASILKYKGIPARVRYGFAPYLIQDKGLHISHVICEVWNDKEKRWMLVDPYKKMVDFPKNEFEFGGDVWLQYQNEEIGPPEKYGVGVTWGAHSILDMLCHDMASVLGQELSYWERPPIAKGENINISEKEKVKILNNISLLLRNPDLYHDEMKVVYGKHRFLQYQDRPGL